MEKLAAKHSDLQEDTQRNYWANVFGVSDRPP
jgi:hypothetical protein